LAWKEDHKVDSNFWQPKNLILGGTLLISAQGEIVFKSLEDTAGELPDVEGLVRAGQALQSQENGEAEFHSAMTPQSLMMAGFDFSRVK
jgi:hypothetical protein